MLYCFLREFHITLLFIQSMVFILTLLGVFMYIFAVAGTVMFSNKSDRTDLEYKESFRYILSVRGEKLFCLHFFFYVHTQPANLQKKQCGGVYF